MNECRYVNSHECYQCTEIKQLRPEWVSSKRNTPPRTNTPIRIILFDGICVFGFIFERIWRVLHCLFPYRITDVLLPDEPRHLILLLQQAKLYYNLEKPVTTCSSQPYNKMQYPDQEKLFSLRPYNLREIYLNRSQYPCNNTDQNCCKQDITARIMHFFR